MKDLTEKNVLLIGAGPMAVDYDKVLRDMKISYKVVGRSQESANKFQNETKTNVITGGIEKWLLENKDHPNYAIVAVTGTELGKVARILINNGIMNILLEKPGGLDYNDIKSVAQVSKVNHANVLLAYNRRFYASVKKAKEIIQEDGGVKSYYFEFTEWPHTIIPLPKDPKIKERWFLHNSTHVVDLAFYLGGEPDEIQSYSKGEFDWHPSGTVFTGAGISNNGALFSYHSNWDAPGRWGIEVLTSKHRLFFRPLEKLQIQKLKTVVIEELEIDNQIDIDYKPGLYRQVEAFLNNDLHNFINIHQQASRLEIFKKICNEKN
ncbi:MAG: Gfo/Idh/MocA family protein [Candidatus Hodarchaeota archaeon]